jgi:hypothetical protein
MAEPLFRHPASSSVRSIVHLAVKLPWERRRAQGAQLRAAARASGADQVTDAEIEKEIAAARRTRARHAS